MNQKKAYELGRADGETVESIVLEQGNLVHVIDNCLCGNFTMKSLRQALIKEGMTHVTHEVSSWFSLFDLINEKPDVACGSAVLEKYRDGFRVGVGYMVGRYLKGQTMISIQKHVDGLRKHVL